MTYGISVQNTSGYITIDEAFSGFAVIASGTAVGGATVEFPPQTTVPIVMVSVPVGVLFFFPMALASTTLHNFGVGMANGATLTYSYKVLVPRTTMTANASVYGLRVFNASSQVMFDSESFNSLRVLSFSNIPRSSLSAAGGATVTVPDDAADLYVSLRSCRVIAFTPGGGSQGVVIGAVVKINSRTSVTIQYGQVGACPPINNDFGVESIAMIIGTFA